MPRKEMPAKKTRRRLALRLAVVLGMLTLLVMPYDIGEADDTFLFRVQSGKPYVYVIFDTSSSMNLSAELGGVLTEANGDDPLSTFFQAKSAVYEVFNRAFVESGDFIHYGFMGYNQDGLRVKGKHWLYAFEEGQHVDLGDGEDRHYPKKGELLTFGADLPVTASPDDAVLPLPAPGFLGTCENPVDFNLNRAAVNRFPKLHPVDLTGNGFVDEMLWHFLWLREEGVTYGLFVETHEDSLVGTEKLEVDFTLFVANDLCTEVEVKQKKTVTFKLVRPFLMHDLLGADNASDIVETGPVPVAASLDTLESSTEQLALTNLRMTSLKDPLSIDFSTDFSRLAAPAAPAEPGGGGGGGGGQGTKEPERQAGIWNYQDYTARAVCGDNTRPFTGIGGEGNYDGGTFVGNAVDFPFVDPFGCPNGNCDTLKYPTVLDANLTAEWRTLDTGDMLPFHWTNTHREAFFSRLAPNWTPGKPLNELDFGIAGYFRDVPNSSGFLELINPNRKPLMAFGDSPVGEALVDWRCFYLGSDMPGGKCRDDRQPFGRGWDWLAPQFDLEWGCRKPFIIIIGDGENNCFGENPAADTANLRRNRVKAWVINFGGPDSRDLRTLAENTGGEYVEVDNKDELLTVLENILGEIVEETRAFASAVVPTVQAEEADKVFVSNFKPLNQASVWPGAVQAFLKPVPIDGAGRPDTSIDCGNDPDVDPAGSCFLWNAGEEMLSQVSADINTQFGDLQTQRRVYYSRLSAPGEWPKTRRFLAPTSNTTPDATAVRYDLWRGLGLILPNVLDGSLDAATETLLEAEANAVVTEMMAMKVDDNDTPEDISDDESFILGDVFHSDPLIVGTPINTKFFAMNLKDDGQACEDGNPSYRCFFREHQNRRKVIVVGSNDGETHAIDAGIFRTSGPFKDGFDRGSGKEVFAYTPRGVLPTVKSLFGDGINRTWTVDGGLTGIDAFIDPVADSAVFPDPDDREWRSIVLGGLRRGGKSFYALDITQPDKYNSENEPIGIDGFVPSCTNGGSGCGPVPYPSQLWEFNDSHLDSDPPREIPFDQDFDGIEDMVASWSAPNLGLIKVCTSDNCDETVAGNGVEDRFVAIMGGGLDKTNSTGNFLYMVDLETGLAIYKRELQDLDGVTSGGSAAAEPAAVDTDGDGYLDRIYISTLKGLMYRVDLRGANGEIPKLVETKEFLQAGNQVPPPVDVVRITSDDFRPRIIFKAQPDVSTPGPVSRAIYFRPSVIFSAALGRFALAFGTGDRENLWASDGERGVFYMVKDDIKIGDFTTFYTEADLVDIDSEVDADTNLDLLTDPLLSTKGWFMILRENERLITNPFAVSGVVVFTVFDPDVDVDLKALTCSRTGRSRVFGVTATNGNGLLFDGGVRTRWFDIADFVTEPYIEQAQTKNPDAGNDTATADDLTADHLAIMEELKKLFPTNCKFANYRLDIKTLSSDTGIHLIAPIPICIVEKNWKEF